MWLNSQFIRFLIRIFPSQMWTGISSFANLTLLECLKIPGSEQVTPKDLKDLFSKLNNLKTVDISECKKGATDMSVTALANNNPKLRYLALDECELITGKSVKTLADKCPLLEHISMDGCYQVRDCKGIFNLSIQYIACTRAFLISVL